jgi:hypothetical protein
MTIFPQRHVKDGDADPCPSENALFSVKISAVNLKLDSPRLCDQDVPIGYDNDI